MTFPPGRARLEMNPAAIGSPTAAITIGILPLAFRAASVASVPAVKMTCTFIRTRSAARIGSRSSCRKIKRNILAVRPPSFLKRCAERGDASLCLRVTLNVRQEHAYSPHLHALLPACSERPRGGSASKKCGEFPPFHGLSSCRGPRRVRGRISHFEIENCAVSHTWARNRLCLLWVKSRHRGISDQCPLYPQKRTSLSAVAMSAFCQKRTLAPNR